MHRRFRGASAVELRCPGGTIRVVLAEAYGLRLLGLMRLQPDEIEPLLFLRCRSVHTHGMRTPIDLVWLAVNGEQGRVLGVEEDLKPGRHARAPRGTARRSIAALELPSGETARLSLAPRAGLSLSYGSLPSLGGVRPAIQR